ncbi:MAG: GtrA family protein [Clostridia bacterium]|nr:GtrA family protein [Clostridia bacterium]
MSKGNTPEDKQIYINPPEGEQIYNNEETPAAAPKQDKKALLMELLRYCVAGGVAFLFDTATLYLFNEHILPYMGRSTVAGIELDWRLALATTLGFIVGITVNYLVSIWFVFTTEKQKQRGRNVKAFLLFALVGFIGYLLTVGGVQLGCWMFGVYEGFGSLVVRAAVAGIVMLWNYIGRKVLVYKGE